MITKVTLGATTDLLSNLMIGVISGIVTSLLIWFFVFIYKSIISHKIKELLYRGVELEGEWYGEVYHELTDKDGSKTKYKRREMTLMIHQSAYQITGEFIAKNLNPSKTETISFYKFTGFIRDNCVVVNYLPKSKKSIGMGSLIFAVKDGGRTLIGNIIGTDVFSMNLFSEDGIQLSRR